MLIAAASAIAAAAFVLWRAPNEAVAPPEQDPLSDRYAETQEATT
jgi:hypothetical protein